MSHAVFTIKAGSGYDDVPEERYHFPGQYLARAQQTIGDLIIYYEPRRGDGRLSYIAMARVLGIDEDPERKGHYYARIGDYLDFDAPVPFRDGDLPFESVLRSEGQTGLSGEFRNAVRLIPPHEFEAIVATGFLAEIAQTQTSTGRDRELAEDALEFRRPIVEQVTRRPFRDAAFARRVKTAYESKCAFTGLDMRNGGGRTEVDAAHIKPVGDGHLGPDSVRNGLALSKTIHWMFDRGLLSVGSDFGILMAKNLVPEPIKRLIVPGGRILLPHDAADRPHPAFLDYHRNRIFKGSEAGG